MNRVAKLSLTALVCTSLLMTGAVGAANAAPAAVTAQQRSTVDFDIKPTSTDTSVVVELANGSTRDAGDFVEILDVSGTVVEKLPKSAVVKEGTFTYTATSSTTLEVSLDTPSADAPDYAGFALKASAKKVKWADSWDKCVAEAALGGAAAGALAGSLPGAIVGMIGVGAASALLQCRGLPHL
ncbi:MULTISPECIES: hypothetical protein [Cryobacterium]|uniref:DUF8020 domain-containing protein n=1 Tax=Cryobacterium breve TaxID=1259258 RepID=A0ABY2J3H7_9MICO|nr:MULTISPECIES: hypothetical protein [Cryobacterium]TFC92992.1 hypothetical protein E3T20_11055 [Cryobacterium sp. TmT3-12]TFC98892.1 hypothetical protein E3O65_07080 [Cryobacterium breve]